MHLPKIPFLFSALFAQSVYSHSWIEQMNVIGSNGSYTGAPGYPRNYVWGNDQVMTVLLPPNGQGRTKLDSSDMVCAQSQATVGGNTPGYPSLITQPGSYVAVKYLENGHVTLPQNQLGKPGSGGVLAIYATTASQNAPVLDILKWSSTNTLAQGKLLTLDSFDDGRCYQINSGPMSMQRQTQFPDPIPGQPGTTHEQWCEIDFQIPADAPEGNLVLYWVWQWPTFPNVDPGVPSGKDEVYTTCADIMISKSANMSAAVYGTAIPNQDPQNMAVPSYQQRAMNTTYPANPNFYGPNSASAGSSSSAVASSASSISATVKLASVNAAATTVTVTVTASASACPSLAARAFSGALDEIENVADDIAGTVKNTTHSLTGRSISDILENAKEETESFGSRVENATANHHHHHPGNLSASDGAGAATIPLPTSAASTLSAASVPASTATAATAAVSAVPSTPATSSVAAGASSAAARKARRHWRV